MNGTAGAPVSAASAAAVAAADAMPPAVASTMHMEGTAHTTSYLSTPAVLLLSVIVTGAVLRHIWVTRFRPRLSKLHRADSADDAAEPSSWTAEVLSRVTAAAQWIWRTASVLQVRLRGDKAKLEVPKGPVTRDTEQIEMLSVKTEPRPWVGVAHRGLVLNTILEEAAIEQIAACLPLRYMHKDWKLLYSSTTHGLALSAFFGRVTDRGPTVIVLKDSAQHVFGAFIPESWRIGADTYFGSGETFVMTIRPRFAVYKWTRANSYFVMATRDSVALGGGNGFALCLDSSLTKGNSMPCETFGNPTLSSTADFSCHVVEAWAFA